MGFKCVLMICGAIYAACVLPGCLTAHDPDAPPAVAPGTPLPFVPQIAKASLNYAKGPYRNLFSQGSYADWKLAEGPETADAIEITCCLESAFPDSSIAYDAAGLRGITVYLYMPDGRRISAAQTVVGGQLEEEAQGSLKVFRRVNRLTFPAAGLTVSTPTLDAPAPGVRLVLEGHNSVYFFEWPAQLPQEIKPLPFHKSPEAEKLKRGLKKAGDKTREVSHTFD